MTSTPKLTVLEVSRALGGCLELALLVVLAGPCDDLPLSVDGVLLRLIEGDLVVRLAPAGDLLADLPLSGRAVQFLTSLVLGGGF